MKLVTKSSYSISVERENLCKKKMCRSAEADPEKFGNHYRINGPDEMKGDLFFSPGCKCLSGGSPVVFECFHHT